MGPGSRAAHLSYLGDAQIGARVNVGAGAITANFDGRDKHPTVIQDNCKLGANCVLVAPVTLGEGVTVAAGSVVTEDVPPMPWSLPGRARWSNPVGDPLPAQP